MSDLNQPEDAPADAVDQLMAAAGFDLRNVTWGYREIFRDALTDLVRQGLVGAGSAEVDEVFFDILKGAHRPGLDGVLKGFLEALRGEHRWIMRLPRLVERWGRTGLRLAEDRHFLGARFFEYSAQGKLGHTPKEVEFVLDLIGLLMHRAADLVGPLLEGYGYLRAELGLPEIREFVLDALRLHERAPVAAGKLLAGELESSQTYLRRATRQAGLSHSSDALGRLARALAGRTVTIEGLGALDADDLQERGSMLVGCRHGLYVPERIAEFPSQAMNQAAYKTMVVMACTCEAAGGFYVAHGSAGLRTCRDLFAENSPGADTLCALFCLAETCRITRACRRLFPGAAADLDRLTSLQFEMSRPRNRTDSLMAQLLTAPPKTHGGRPDELAPHLRSLAAESDGFETTRRLVSERFDALGAGDLPAPGPMCFFPDPLFPLAVSSPSADQLKVDIRDTIESPPDDEADSRDTEEQEAPEDAHEPTPEGSGSGATDDGAAGGARSPAYYYHEWNVHAADYLRDWCLLRECHARDTGIAPLLDEAARRQAEQVRQVFQRMRPEETRQERRLLEGDAIHIDHFMDYIVQGDQKQSSEMRFYSKPLTKKRDLAVAVLLDLSGSTAEDCDAEAESTVLDVEKQAAFVLATGLAELGDVFGLFGFTGNGRENCAFYVFKDFEEQWRRNSLNRLFGVTPGSSTRIGVALRHAGWKLTQREAKTKLLLLITDGKPCDQGYDTESHYAQHDIRKACGENQQRMIHTFCVSTSENTPADMELMFSGNRYLILKDIAQLPGVLSRLYLRLTR